MFLALVEARFAFALKESACLCVSASLCAIVVVRLLVFQSIAVFFSVPAQRH